MFKLFSARALAPAIFLILAAQTSLALAASNMETLSPGPDGSFHFSDCHARLAEGRLTIGNAHVERAWFLNDQCELIAVSFRDLESGQSWIAPSAADPGNPQKENLCELTAAASQAGVTEEPSLRLTLTTTNNSATIQTRFQVFAAARGILMDREVVGGAPAAAPAANARFNVLEEFIPAPKGWELTRVKFLDQTDRQAGPLAVETPCRESDPEFSANPNAKIARQSFAGNVFFLEDPRTSTGLLFLKHAPLPAMRPPREANPKSKRPDMTQLYWDRTQVKGLSLESNEITSAGGKTYRWVTLAYNGGRAGRIAALQQYHRQLRKYDPARDGLVLTNTWGDRSLDGRVSEEFMKKEIPAAARLGVDVVEIDDGWQKGATANSVNAVKQGGVWNAFYARDANFWAANPERFPHGIKPLADLAAAQGMQFGLWFAPDSSDDFKNWEKDRDLVLGMHRERGVNYFKFDGIKMHTAAGEANVHRLVESVIEGSGGRVSIDLDVTAEVRPGYFGIPNHGPIFVENRYTDSGAPTPEKSVRGYWPHKTLRNFWLLAQYVDPARLRMEFLNNARNAAKYGDNPLAPAKYAPDYLFATVMFGAPLGWFESQNLPAEYVEKVAPLAKIRKEHREAIFNGSIIPIGDVPSGAAWTGFVSVAPDRRSAYALVFRELNDQSTHEFELPLLSMGDYSVAMLAGSGQAAAPKSKLRVTLPNPRSYALLKVTPK